MATDTMYEELAPVTSGVKEKTELVPMLHEVCDTFKAPGGKFLKISFFPLAEQLEVMGDRPQLAYMLKILLLNSSRFAPANSTVKVFVERQADNAVIRVIDKGVGIPDDVLPHLFEVQICIWLPTSCSRMAEQSRVKRTLVAVRSSRSHCHSSRRRLKRLS